MCVCHVLYAMLKLRCLAFSWLLRREKNPNPNLGSAAAMPDSPDDQNKKGARVRVLIPIRSYQERRAEHLSSFSFALFFSGTIPDFILLTFLLNPTLKLQSLLTPHHYSIPKPQQLQGCCCARSLRLRSRRRQSRGGSQTGSFRSPSICAPISSLPPQTSFFCPASVSPTPVGVYHRHVSTETRWCCKGPDVGSSWVA